MNPPCAKCSKLVYPTEKLNCLDKVWHKLCFKCETCGLLLNMKNYKGYNKRPYCNTHYPTTKFTAVADTPENRRLKNQTQNQSQLTYHAEHKKNMQQFTAVADTPENARLKKNTQQSSMAVYKASAPPPAGYSAPPPTGYAAGPPSSGRAEERQYQPPVNDPPYQPPAQQQAPPPAVAQPPPPAAPASSGPQYVAVYDYTAADDDEVSFVEGDIIVNAEVIDAGWMTGMVKRTGETGMLPSNYVEPC